jgi:hypothetical protein
MPDKSKPNISAEEIAEKASRLARMLPFVRDQTGTRPRPGTWVTIGEPHASAYF